nr:PREDICTED: post-GPI attachment to proteins factor 2 isoform X1 [Lepisosteus oculatus]
MRCISFGNRPALATVLVRVHDDASFSDRLVCRVRGGRVLLQTFSAPKPVCRIRMLQGLGGPDRDSPVFRLRFTTFIVGTVCLPLIGFVFCIFISLIFHFDDSTATHCKVPNYLPSISASISLIPERYIWRFCISLHAAPRFLAAVSYWNFYNICFKTQRIYQFLSFLNLLLNILENLGLLLLTYVCSSENYWLHKNGFITFIGSSILHMLVTCLLWKIIKVYSVSPEEQTSYKWKIRLFFFNLILCIIACYFYVRHNRYCEPGIYTCFAFCEYFVVFSNMAFHLTAYWDFGNKDVMVVTPPESKRF